MSLRIVSHCWCQKLPQYAQFLRFQLSSLVLHKPSFPVSITVVCTPEDDETIGVLRWFSGMTHHDDLSLDVLPLAKDEVTRRSIGRNKAALASTEDLVWFADVDYVFGEDCLDSLWRVWTEHAEPKPVLLHPRTVQIQASHERGDELVSESRQQTERLLRLPEDERWETKRYHTAIGGVQIASGDLCRARGYLDGQKKWQTPTPHRPFHTREDIAFRALCLHWSQIHERPYRLAVELPHLYRLRHTQCAYQ